MSVGTGNISYSDSKSLSSATSFDGRLTLIVNMKHIVKCCCIRIASPVSLGIEPLPSIQVYSYMPLGPFPELPESDLLPD